MNDKLTTKQRLFVEAYLADPNATKAALAAGYSPKTAYSIGQQNLKKVEIQDALGKRVQSAIITADEILTDVKTIAKSAERDGDKLKAYEMLGKYLKLWTDKQEITGKDGGPLEVEQVIRPKLEQS